MTQFIFKLWFDIIIVIFIWPKTNSINIDRHNIPICPDELRFSSNIRLHDEYDVIVIGAGAAGCIVSTELATALNMSVLLVEAGVETGNNDNYNISDPARWLNVVHNDTLEWHYRSVPQTALNDRIIELGFAKGTGGSAMHNAMGYVRGGQRWSVIETCIFDLLDYSLGWMLGK